MAADFYHNPSSYPFYFPICIFQAKFQFIWLLFLQKLFSHVLFRNINYNSLERGECQPLTLVRYVIHYTKTPWIYTMAFWFAPSSFPRDVISIWLFFVVLDCCWASYTEPYLHYLEDLFPEWHTFSWAHHCTGTRSCLPLVHINLHLLVSSTYNQAQWEPSASFCFCYPNSVIFGIYCHFITQPFFQAIYYYVQQHKP